MSTVILKGEDAIHYARVHHLSLHCEAGEGEPARDDLDPETATRIAAEHPERIWVETRIPVNSAEPRDVH